MLTPERRHEAMLLALGGFSLLSCGDAIIKSIGHAWPGPAIAALRYLFGALGLGVLAWRQGGRRVLAMPDPRLHWVRGAAVALATVGFFMAIRVMPLADAIAVVFVGPMITSVLSAVVLGERAPRAVWISCAIAFAGVLVVLRPEVARLGAAALFPLLSALGMSVLIIANRKAAGSAPALQLQFYVAATGAACLLLITALGAASGLPELALTPPPNSVIAKTLVVAFTASLAHWLIFKATERASAAVVAPMTYVQILIASVLGWLVFGDRPDLGTLVGAALIIGAGLYLWRAQQPAKPDPESEAVG